MQVTEIDNRDSGTTWLWTNKEMGHIEINPVEIMANMIVNCYNEDMLFLFEVLNQFMEQDLEYHMDNDFDIHETRADYITQFRNYLTSMIEAGGKE